MPIHSDTASLDAFPTNVVVVDDPLPCADSGSNTVTEVLIISHDGVSDDGACYLLRTTLVFP